jgi:hypothetical protein
MKTKLLKHIRKNYRIIENGLWQQKLQIKHCLFWCEIDNYSWYKHLLNQNTEIEFFKAYIHLKYSHYSRKCRIKEYKLKQIKVIWHERLHRISPK